mmetsp:Transcript_11406/g.25873  ORF Transcript_11406/g.25873 Transcript_11406/m.25873 type:complete len:310 (-) Transcript_11406:8-937(-)
MAYPCNQGHRTADGPPIPASATSWAQCERLLKTAGWSDRGSSVPLAHTGLDLLPPYIGCEGIHSGLGEDVDEVIFHGGLTVGEVYELRGATESGKTQMALTMAASLSSRGHRVVYACSKDPPCALAERLQAVLIAQGGGADTVITALDHIDVLPVADFHGLARLLVALPSIGLKQNGLLLVVDTLSSIVGPYFNVESWAPRWRLTWARRALEDFAQAHGAIVLAAVDGCSTRRGAMPEVAENRLELMAASRAVSSGNHCFMTRVLRVARSAMGTDGEEVELAITSAGVCAAAHAALQTEGFMQGTAGGA